MVIWGYTPRRYSHIGVWAQRIRGGRFHVPKPAPNSILTRWQGAPAAHAEHVPFFLSFSGTLQGLTASPRRRCLTKSPLWPHIAVVFLRNSTKFLEYPRVTIILTPFNRAQYPAMITCQPQKQVRTLVHVTLISSPNSPKTEHPAVASNLDKKLRRDTWSNK